MFAAGIGSAVSTIRSFLLHASTRKDFDPAQVPWYVARPLMGMLLGFIFYFLLAGGVLLLIAAENEPTDIEGFNDWGLSGAGALVGLFSREAIEKLREVFHTMFRTQADVLREENAVPKGLTESFVALPQSVRKTIHTLLSDEGKLALAERDDKTLIHILSGDFKLRASLIEAVPEPDRKQINELLRSPLMVQFDGLTFEEQKKIIHISTEVAEIVTISGDSDRLKQTLTGLQKKGKFKIEEFPEGVQKFLKMYFEPEKPDESE